MILLLLVWLGSAAGQRGHYIVDYQRLPLYQEFYLSPGLYRPLFPAGHHEPRRIDAPLAARHHKLQAHGIQAVPATAVQQQQQSQTETQTDAARPVVTPPPDNSLSQEPVVVVAQEQTPAQPHDTVVINAPDHQPSQHLNQQPSTEHPPPVLTYSNSMTPDGSYSYKYETADGLMREESSVMEPTGEDGKMVATVRGSYSYPGPDGRMIRVDYVADGGGFRASGDHLPSSLQDTIYNFKYVIP